jgi:hypothetical protein
MTAAERMRLSTDADARRLRAEAVERAARVGLFLAGERIAALEFAEARRRRRLIQSAAERLVATGAIHRGDHFGQFRMAEQFIKDPALISLALQRRIFGRDRLALGRDS